MDDVDASLEPLPPQQVITATDKRGLVTVITAVLLSFVLASLLTRIYIRVRISGSWRKDDSCVLAATVLCIGYSAVLFTAVKNDFGLTLQDVDPSRLGTMGELAYAADVIYILVMLLSKAATAFLFIALSPERGQTITAWTILACSSVWAVASIPAMTVGCSPTTWVDSCPGELLRWKVITAFNIFTEILLLFNAVYLVSGLKMPLKMKAAVTAVFSVRLPVIAASIARLHYKKLEVQAMDTTLAAAVTAVWTTLELSYALISCTLLTLGPVITPFEKAYAAPNSYRRPSYKLSSLSRSRSSKPMNSAERPGSSFNERILRPDDFGFSANIEANAEITENNDGRSGRSTGSSESQRAVLAGGISKQVEWVTTVEETREPDPSWQTAEWERRWEERGVGKKEETKI